MTTDIRCDRCGKVIHSARSVMKLTHTRNWLQSWERDDVYDLCKPCADNFRAWRARYQAEEEKP